MAELFDREIWKALNERQELSNSKTLRGALQENSKGTQKKLKRELEESSNGTQRELSESTISNHPVVVSTAQRPCGAYFTLLSDGIDETHSPSFCIEGEESDKAIVFNNLEARVFTEYHLAESI